MQCEGIVLRVEHPSRERGFEISVRVRVPGIDIPAHADPRRLEDLVESRSRRWLGLGEHRGRGREQRGNSRDNKKFFHCWTFRWVRRPSPFSTARARFLIPFYQGVDLYRAEGDEPRGTEIGRNRIVTHRFCAVGQNAGEAL